MGCGAGKYGASGNMFNRKPAFDEDDEEVPEGIVLCSATRPDWGQIDYLVFEAKDAHDLSPPGTADIRELCPDDDTDEVLAQSRSSVNSRKSGAMSKPREGPEKGGRFFSKRQECVGTWRICGNVLSLVWPFTMRTDTAIAMESEKVWVNQQTRMTISVLEPKEENPDWFQPDIIAEKFQSDTVASKQFECPVCFFELFKFPTGVIRLHSRRCCGHYFHKACVTYLLKKMSQMGGTACCPTCGAEFAEVKTMPDLATDPRDWFAVCDVDFGGELDAYEVVEALGCVLPVNRHKLEKHVRAHWHEWDPDGDGTITLQEFIMPGRGLKDWIITHLNMLKADAAPKPNTVPSIDRNPREWFHYWDRDGSGTLEKDEIVRALIRTFCRDENGNPHLTLAHDMLEIAASLWTSLGYSPFDAVAFEEFVRPYGLLDQFLHNQTHCAYFGLDCELIA